MIVKSEGNSRLDLCRTVVFVFYNGINLKLLGKFAMVIKCVDKFWQILYFI